MIIHQSEGIFVNGVFFSRGYHEKQYSARVLKRSAVVIGWPDVSCKVQWLVQINVWLGKCATVISRSCGCASLDEALEYASSALLDHVQIVYGDLNQPVLDMRPVPDKIQQIVPGRLKDCIQILIRHLGEPVWINVQRTDLKFIKSER